MLTFESFAELLQDSIAGEEAIDFQVNTDFADSINAIFKDIIQYRESCRGDRQIVRKVADYAKTKMRKEFKLLWKKHLNIELNEIEFSSNVDFAFAMSPILCNNAELVKIVDSMAGTAIHGDNIDLNPATAEEVERISSKLNLQIGKSGASKMFDKFIGMTLYFDPYYAFLTKDTLSISTEYLTSEELTAIVLHEVGHMMSLIEHCGDTYFRIKLNATIINNFLETAPLLEKIKLVKLFLADKYINKITASLIGKDMVEKISKVTDNMSSSYEQHKDDNYHDSSKSFWATIINFFICTAVMALTCALTVIAPVYVLIFAFFQLLSESVVRDFIQYGGPVDPKYSDFMGNRTNAFNWERWADEYVTRYGYGSHLTTGLKKLTTAASATGMFIGDGEKGVDIWIRNSSAFFAASYAITTIFTLAMTIVPDDGFGIYETFTARVKRLAQDYIAAIKNKNLPDSMMDHYIEEYEKIIQTASNPTFAMRCGKINAVIKKILVAFIDPIKVTEWISTGNIKAEYADLMDDIDNLKYNPLFYNAAKLNSLISNRNKKK